MKKPIADSAAEWRAMHVPGNCPKIRSDAELRAFVDAKLKTGTFVEIAAACLKRFGAARAPGKSAIHRYWRECVRDHTLTPPATPATPPARRPRKKRRSPR